MAVTYIRSDLEFILQQILIAEQHAAGADLTTLIPNAFVPFGLRTVDGSFNNLFPGKRTSAPPTSSSRGCSTRSSGTRATRSSRWTSAAPVQNTDYGAPGNVVDADPRIISNLIVDQTSSNPAAVAVAGSAGADLASGVTQTTS